ncbi:response regulator transcription factor [uncultured Deinococcus sp.]|uniref:helix-turn-helix transcriptional regulator n=1 Tax=uncultured Deinococcus sp. TaxID=158789 RepID=UPI0025891D3B|nr:response regulator transcription factor [uncultured Deinococcus sp.]
MTAQTSAFSLPTARVVMHPGIGAAGAAALLASAGVRVVTDPEEEADVLVVDDSWLAEPQALAGATAVVALGSPVWAALLAEWVPGGFAALSAQATAAELLAGVLGAAAGLAVLPPTALGPLDPADDEDDLGDLTAGADVGLTPRERDVLEQLAAGLSNKRAARELGVSESTVKFHVQALYAKLGVQSRAGAVARGIALGLVSV